MTTTDTAQTEGAPARSQAADLDLRNVSKRYPGQDAAAVEELSLTVPAGHICVLVGPSGCGKTTLMRMINRMIEPTSGDILLDGSSVRQMSPHTLRREIERYQRPAMDPERAVEFLLPHLRHDDRFIRYAARVALEHQPVRLAVPRRRPRNAHGLPAAGRDVRLNRLLARQRAVCVGPQQ